MLGASLGKAAPLKSARLSIYVFDRNLCPLRLPNEQKCSAEITRTPGKQEPGTLPQFQSKLITWNIRSSIWRFALANPRRKKYQWEVKSIQPDAGSLDSAYDCRICMVK